jgi:hypothetical protein
MATVYKIHPAIGIARVLCRQDLQRDVAPEPRVVREVHLAHAARAEQREDFVGAEAITGSQTQGSSPMRRSMF